MTTSIETIGVGFDTSGLVKGQRELDATTRAANKTADAADGLAASTTKADKAADSAATSLRGMGAAVAALGLGAAVAQAVKMADSYTQMNARLGLVVTGTEALVNVQGKLFDLAQASRSNLGATVDLYTALARSTKELGLSQNDLLTVTETFNKAITISGASTQAAQAAITQFNQAMASGVLRGEEFNSIAEQAPRIMDLLASSLGKTRGELRAMAEAGQLTSGVVLPAIMAGAEGVRAEFERMPVTVSQAMGVIENSLTAFVGTLDASTGATRGLAAALVDVSAIIDAATAAMDRNGAAGNKNNVIIEGLLVTFETLSVLGVNIAYTFEQIGKEIGAMGAELAALLTLDFEKLRNIGLARGEEAEAARAQVDALSDAILNGRAKAEAAREALANYKATTQEVALEAQRLGIATTKTATATNAAADAAKKAAAAQKALNDARKAAAVHAENVNRLAEAEYEIGEKIAESAAKRAQATNDAAIAGAEALEKQAEAAEFELETLGMSEAAVYSLLEARKLEEAEAKKRAGTVSATVIDSLEREAKAYRRLADAALGKAAAEPGKDAARQVESEWDKTSDRIADGLTDALMRGFSSGEGFAKTLGQSVINMFKTMAVEPALRGLVETGLSAVGLGGQGGGQSVSSLLGNASTWLEAGKTIWQGISSGFSLGGVSGAFSGLGNALFGSAAAGAGGGSAATAGLIGSGGLSASISSIGSTIAAAWPAAIAAGIYASGKLYDAGYKGQGTAGTIFSGGLNQLSDSKTWQMITGGPVADFISNKLFGGGGFAKQGGSAFAASGTATTADRNYRLYTPTQADAQLQTTTQGIADAYAQSAKALGLKVQNFVFGLGYDADPMGKAGNRLTSQLIGQDRTGAPKLYESLNRQVGKDADMGYELTLDASRLLLAAVKESLASSDLSADVAEAFGAVFGAVDIAGASMEQIKTIQDGLNAVAQFVAALDQLGVAFPQLSDVSYKAGKALAEAFGGLDKLVAGLSEYQQNFYTEAELTKTATDALTAEMAKLGYTTLPTTREGFRALVEQLGPVTDANQEQFAALIKLSGAFAALVPATVKATDATETRVEADTSAADAARAAADAARQAEEAQRLYNQQMEEAARLAREAAATQRQLMDRYGTEAEVVARAQADLVIGFAQLGERIPQSAADLAALVAKYDAATPAGQAAISKIAGLASAFDTVADAATRARSAAEAQAAAAQDSATRFAQGVIDAGKQFAATVVAAAQGRVALANRYGTGEEVTGRAYDQIASVAGQLGVGGNMLPLAQLIGTDPAELRRIVSGLIAAADPMTESGRDLIATLQGLAPAFDTVIAAAEQATSAAQANAQANQQLAAAMADAALQAAQAASEAARQSVQTALEGVQAAVEAEREALRASYEGQADAIREQIELTGKAADKYRSLSSVLRSALTLQASTPLAGVRREGQRALADMLATARAGGGLPDEEKLKTALGAVSKPSEGLFSSFREYLLDFDRTRADIADLSALTDDALSVEDRTLAAAEAQLTALEAGFEAENARLDGILAAAQAQVAALLGVSSGVSSVAAAVAALSGAIAASKTADATLAGAQGRAREATLGGLVLQAQQGDIAGAIRAGTLAGFSPQDLAAAYNARVSTGGASAGSIVDFARANGIPLMAEGGVTNGPSIAGEGRYREAVIPLSNGRSVPVDLPMGELLDEIKGLRADIRAGDAGSIGVANRVNRLLDRWDREGLPAERDA